MAKDCFFYTDKIEGEEVICALCVTCNEKIKKSSTWFWPGSQLGYGPWDLFCENCNSVISSTKDETEDQLENQ